MCAIKVVYTQRLLRPTISQRHPKAGRLSSKSGPDMIISCGDQKLVGSARQCPTLAVWALRLGVPKATPELLPWPVGVLVVASMGWCFKRLSQNPHWGGVPKVGVVLQKIVREPLIGWCWGGVPKRCPRILDGVVFKKLGWFSKKLSQNPRWGGVPKVGVVFQKVVPESSMG